MATGFERREAMDLQPESSPPGIVARVHPGVEAVVAAATGALGTMAATLSTRLATRRAKKLEEEERRRLRVMVFGANAANEPLSNGSDGSSAIRLDERVDRIDPDKELTAIDPAAVPAPKADSAQHGLFQDHAFAGLLVDYYAYGLTQARRSFHASLVFSVLGGFVLITGVTLAIYHAGTPGQQYASIVASIAGALTAAVGTLFHGRADAAMKHMEAQTQSLRQDMKAERDAARAVELLARIEDVTLREHLQSALILKFGAANLPDPRSLPAPSRKGVGSPR